MSDFLIQIETLTLVCIDTEHCRGLEIFCKTMTKSYIEVWDTTGTQLENRLSLSFLSMPTKTLIVSELACEIKRNLENSESVVESARPPRSNGLKTKTI